MFSETLEIPQYSTKLIPERRTYTFNSKSKNQMTINPVLNGTQEAKLTLWF
jgi:hypothetical protein